MSGWRQTSLQDRHRCLKVGLEFGGGSHRRDRISANIVGADENRHILGSLLDCDLCLTFRRGYCRSRYGVVVGMPENGSVEGHEPLVVAVDAAAWVRRASAPRVLGV